MENLTQQWERFSLPGKEEQYINMENSLEKPEFTLAGRFLTKRVINLESVARTFRLLWRAVNGFRVRDMGGNRAIFIINDRIERERVVSNSPSMYD
jgi:hypothetical protein